MIVIQNNFVLPLPCLQKESFQIGNTEEDLLLVINQAETNLAAFPYPRGREISQR